MQPNEPEITNHKPVTDNSVIFNAVNALLTSAGVNNSEQIRLSLSMAMIDSKQIRYNKPYTAANGRPHYSKLDAK